MKEINLFDLYCLGVLEHIKIKGDRIFYVYREYIKEGKVFITSSSEEEKPLKKHGESCPLDIAVIILHLGRPDTDKNIAWSDEAKNKLKMLYQANPKLKQLGIKNGKKKH